MILNYQEIVNTINNYWTSSKNIKNIIEHLDFSNVKSNIDIKTNIITLLNDKLSTVEYYENLTDEQLYELITTNKIHLFNDNFVNFISQIIDDKFPDCCSFVLKRYIKELKKIQKIEELNDDIVLKIENKIKDDTDYISLYNINKKIIKLYKRELLNNILREYHNGVNYRKLLKKYHPDLNKNIDKEYIQIINELKKGGIFDAK